MALMQKEETPSGLYILTKLGYVLQEDKLAQPELPKFEDHVVAELTVEEKKEQQEKEKQLAEEDGKDNDSGN
ncbi:hypothetical protein Tco_0841101 [Tanacetum coccineum]|uniref:Uncharacterized protein n=1 Tax=Tanacetum coccineum TaxID=301880 RepID=A0ABQ5B130_9ASTR